jgi:hypothetical protein
MTGRWAWFDRNAAIVSEAIERINREAVPPC